MIARVTLILTVPVMAVILTPILTISSSNATASTPGSPTTTDSPKASPSSTLPSAAAYAAGAAPTPQNSLTFKILDSAFSKTYPNQYAGMNLDDNGNQVVHLVGDTAALSSMDEFMMSTLAPYEASGQALPASSVEVESATASLATLNQMQQTVSSNSDQLAQAGVQLESWGVDIVKNALDVTVHDLTPGNTTTSEALLGSQNLELESDVNGNIELSSTTDSVPWYGGDSINYSGQYTSGFPISASGITFNTTAGHCGDAPSSAPFTQNGQGYGYTYVFHNCQMCTGDLQTITTY
jgi:hypothetical protein